jgi:hypothetical protein
VKIHRLTSSFTLFRFHHRKWSLIRLHKEKENFKRRDVKPREAASEYGRPFITLALYWINKQT